MGTPNTDRPEDDPFLFVGESTIGSNVACVAHLRLSWRRSLLALARRPQPGPLVLLQRRVCCSHRSRYICRILYRILQHLWRYTRHDVEKSTLSSCSHRRGYIDRVLYRILQHLWRYTRHDVKKTLSSLHLLYYTIPTSRNRKLHPCINSNKTSSSSHFTILCLHHFLSK